MLLTTMLDRVENDVRLDRFVHAGRRIVRRAVPRGQIRDALHGVWLGHPVHPVLVQVPVGAFLSSAVLDLGGARKQARSLMAVGLAAAVPAAAAGATDWSELHKSQRRVGLVHWAGNVLGLGCYATALALRGEKHSALSRTLSYSGLSLIGASGAVGGHLAFHQAAGANHAAHVRHLVRPGWHDIGVLDDFPVDTPVRATVDDVPLVVVRSDNGLAVLAERCSHLSGPLSEGKLTGAGELRCLECPWHGSTFRLRDGVVIHGPATSTQPAFEVLETGGRVQVRLPSSG